MIATFLRSGVSSLPAYLIQAESTFDCLSYRLYIEHKHGCQGCVSSGLGHMSQAVAGIADSRLTSLRQDLYLDPSIRVSDVAPTVVDWTDICRTGS